MKMHNTLICTVYKTCYFLHRLHTLKIFCDYYSKPELAQSSKLGNLAYNILSVLGLVKHEMLPIMR